MAAKRGQSPYAIHDPRLRLRGPHARSRRARPDRCGTAHQTGGSPEPESSIKDNGGAFRGERRWVVA